MILNTEELQYLLEMAGTVAFAVTAVLAVTPRGIDIFGACVMGVITAIGGGTVRDLILDVPVFWAAGLDYIWISLVASLVAFQANRVMSQKKIHDFMLYLDGLGASLFAIQATHKVMSLNFGMPLAPILLGIITAIGGGLLRDVLAGNRTLLMRRDLYAVPITLGCALYVTLVSVFPERAVMIGFVCVAFTFGLRAAAIRWNLKMPQWLTTTPEPAQGDSEIRR